MALGHAQDEASLLSRLFFGWVNPLVRKGVAGYLQRIDDLFMLPASLDVKRVADGMRMALGTGRTLFVAMHRAHGWEFYAIGVLRLVADMAGFAGPLLLNGLLSHSVQGTNDDDDADADDAVGRETDGQAYLYALGLFGSSLICEYPEKYRCLQYYTISLDLLSSHVQPLCAAPTSTGACRSSQ